MAAYPEPGTPEYDARIMAVRKRLTEGPSTKRTVLTLFGVTLFPVVAALWLGWQAFCAGIPPGLRVALLLVVVALLAVPCRIAWVICRRRMRTGRWSLKPTPEERAEMYRRVLANSRQARWFRTLSLALDVLLLPLCVLNLWILLRPNHPPLDAVGYLCVAVFGALTIFVLRNIVLRFKRKTVDA